MFGVKELRYFQKISENIFRLIFVKDIMDNSARKFSDVFLRSRYDAGKTQAYMAKAMNVSVRTVQNWETGVSCPSQTQTFDWFVKLGAQSLPYYLDYLYPDLKRITADSPTEDIDKALCEIIEQLSIPNLYMI